MPAMSFLENNLPSVLSYLLKESTEPEELRLCLHRPVVVKTRREKRISHVICTRALLEETLARLTEYSFYNHSDTVKEGYLSLPYGIRAGICGSALFQNGKISGIKDLSFLSVRIPRNIINAALPLFSRLKSNGFTSGALLYSLPGVGKTTVLKDLIRLLSESGLSLAVIDERGELSSEEFPLDTAVYRYYRKADAIVMAVKTSCPQMLILDEIGVTEQDALISAACCGVPVVASAHGSSETEILSRAAFKPLFREGIFSLLAGLTRKESELFYHFSFAHEVKGADH
ncbi:MAG: hypothetical protein IJX59_05855 [Clostridia bacterium]|nr:hypothetical protein [Clostridia bacterium]